MDEKSRSLVKRKRITGRVQEWKGHFGWIIPDRSISHQEAALNQGRIYVHKKDVELDGGQKMLQQGDVVDFLVYADGKGLGARECRLHAVAGKEAKRPKVAHSDKPSPVLGMLTVAAQAMNTFVSDGSFVQQCRQMQLEQFKKNMPAQLPKAEQAKNAVVQALRAIVQPPRAVVQPAIQPQTAVQPPKAAMVAPRKAVVQPPKAGVQPPKAVLQPLRAVLQPPKAAVQPLRVLQPLTAQSSNPQRPALRIGVSDPRVQSGSSHTPRSIFGGSNTPTVPARPHPGNTDGHVPKKVPPRQQGASSLSPYQVVRPPQEEAAQRGDGTKRSRGSGQSVAGPEQRPPGAQGVPQGAPSSVVTGFLSRNINQRGQESVDPYDPFDDCEEDPFGRV